MLYTAENNADFFNDIAKFIFARRVFENVVNIIAYSGFIHIILSFAQRIMRLSVFQIVTPANADFPFGMSNRIIFAILNEFNFTTVGNVPFKISDRFKAQIIICYKIMTHSLNLLVVFEFRFSGRIINRLSRIGETLAPINLVVMRVGVCM